MTRVGFLGAGFIATFHSKMLRASGVDHTRVGVYDPDPVRAADFVAKAGGHVAASVDEVLAGADAVYVCSWTAAHEELVAAAVDAGVAVFVEKPLSVDLAGAERVARSLTDAGLTHQVGLILRWSPAYALAQSLLEDTNRVGRLMTAVLRDDQVIPLGGRYASAWRGDKTKAGAGVLLEHSIHDLDVLDRLVGPLRRVSAQQRSFHEIDGIEDLVVATLESDNGAVATLTTVWHDNADRNSLRLLELHCERGLITVEEDWFGPVRLQNAGTVQEWSASDLLDECRRRGLPVANPDGAFLDSVAQGRPGMPDATIALRAHRLCDAVYRSAADGGQPVVVD